MADYITVERWGDFQHYNDRNPPWIKVHRTILRDYEFSKLSDSSKLLLIEIWLLAADDNGRVPNDIKWIKKQIPFDGKIDFKPLIDSGFIVMEQSASKKIAKCKQSATPRVSVSVSVSGSINIYWSENNLTKEYAAFKKMRRQIKKPINDVALTRLIAKHKKLVEDGNDPAEIINRSTESCWASFYEVKNGNRQTKELSPAEEYELRVQREDEYISKLNGGDVEGNGKTIPPPVHEEQRGRGR